MEKKTTTNVVIVKVLIYKQSHPHLIEAIVNIAILMKVKAINDKVRRW